MGERRAADAERQAAAAACTALLATVDHPANRRAFMASLSGAERAHLDQLRRLYGGGS